MVVGILILSFALHPGTLNAGTLFGTPATGPLSTPPANSSGPHLNATECAAEEPNVSLIQIIVNLYQGNGNATGSGAGLIYQGPPGPSAYPSESVAESNVIAGWQAVCESSAYFALVQQYGVPPDPINALDHNHTGVYEDVVAIYWQAPAASCGANASSTGSCVGAAEWRIHIASGAVSGPKTSFSLIRVGF